MRMGRSRAVFWALVVPAVASLLGQGAIAQTRAPAGVAPQRGHGASRSATTTRPVARPDAGSGPGLQPAASGRVAASTGGESAGASLTDAGVVEARTLDGGTRVFKFSELDIEGRLRSPQLVYFLRRVRAEFAAGDLGHRTFMREMSETRNESSF
jgi:hypothetical protein